MYCAEIFVALSHVESHAVLLNSLHLGIIPKWQENQSPFQSRDSAKFGYIHGLNAITGQITG